MTTSDKPRNFAANTCGCHSHASGEMGEPGLSPGGLSRRRFLRTTAAATAVGGLVELGAGVVTPRAALAQSTLTPEAALKELMDGNQR